MNDRIKDYFAFTRKEQRGLLVLLGLMILSIAANILMPLFIPEKQYDITAFQKEAEQFLVDAAEQDSASSSLHNNYKKENKTTQLPVLEAFITSPFYFNPNEATEETWRKMGMDERVIKNILRYREKGGFFKDKAGFRKIYGMDAKVFDILEPYLVFEEKVKPDNKPMNEHSRKEALSGDSDAETLKQGAVLIELNLADSAALLDLRGIGPSYAGRIIKYRDRLGGFYSTGQLLEIQGMDSTRMAMFSGQITLDPLLTRKIDLNTVTFKELLKHPYFEYYLVKAVFQRKDEIGRFDSLGQLKSIPVMYEELYEKIKPYLDVR